MRSHCVTSPEQLLMVFVQPANPPGSGSRPRKSIYCWRTKKFVMSIGLGPFTVSLSLMLTVAVDGLPKTAPDGLLRIIRNVSLPSAQESSTIATEKLFDEASPAAQVSVPIVLM